MEGGRRRYRPLLRDFKLQHNQPSDFVHSVACHSPIPYGVWVVMASIHTLTMSIYSGCTSPYKEKIFIWLTYWSFFTLTARFLLTAFNTWRYIVYTRREVYRGDEKSTGHAVSTKELESGFITKAMPTLYKVQWVLQNTSGCCALIVSGLYWTVMYDPNKTESVRSIHSHCLNSLFVLADLLLSRAPVRIHHFIYTFLFMSTYILFTLIYWAAGGQNHLGEPYIYSLLNYSEHPGRAAAVFLAVCFVGTPLLQMVLYAVFRLRQWAVERCRRGKGQAPDGQVSIGLPSVEKGGVGEMNCMNGEAGGSSGVDTENRGRSYTLSSDADGSDAMEDVDLDETRDRPVFRMACRPALESNPSQVSCTDSTKALIN